MAGSDPGHRSRFHTFAVEVRLLKQYITCGARVALRGLVLKPGKIS